MNLIGIVEAFELGAIGLVFVGIRGWQHGESSY
jgi:hypothetical protein